MKSIKTVISVILFMGITMSSRSQQITEKISKHVYVETLPNAVLYFLKDYRVPSSPKRASYDVACLKSKKIKKSTNYEVVEVTNINKVAEYDAYILNIKGKHYIISASDIANNSFLNDKNNDLTTHHQRMIDSVAMYSPSASKDNLMSIVNSRSKMYSDSIYYLQQNKDVIFENRAREDAISYIEENKQRSKERRKKYYDWVSTLPKSVQKDAKLLAIPKSSVVGGYYSLCGFQMYILNMSQKTIKYLMWNGRIKNPVGDYISCEIHHTSSFSGRYTGPCPPFSDAFASWDTVIFNSDADEMVLTSVKIIYTDGSTATIGKQSLDYITNVPREIFTGNAIGYDMSSYYEDDSEVKLEVKIKDNLLLNNSKYERELNEQTSILWKMECSYNAVRRILSENGFSSSMLTNYLNYGEELRILNADKEFIQAFKKHINILDRYKKASQKLSEFEDTYYGFIK